MEENKTTKQKICPNCGEHLTPEQDVCPVCGLGYAAYMEVKSNPKAELAKLYELVESYDGWSTPEEKKERRKEREEKWSKNRGISEEQEDSFLLIIVFIIIMLIYSIGLIPQHSEWIKIWGWVFGGFFGSIIGIIGIGVFLVTLIITLKESLDIKKDPISIVKVKQRIKEIEATGVTYNYQRPKPKEEKVKVRDIYNEKKIAYLLLGMICFCNIIINIFFYIYKVNSIGIVFDRYNSLGENIATCVVTISIIMAVVLQIIDFILLCNRQGGDLISITWFLRLYLYFMGVSLLGMFFGGEYANGAIETFIRWYWLYSIVSSVWNTFFSKLVMNEYYKK